MAILKEFDNHRLMLYYKGDISALTLFTQHENGSVCFPKPLPVLSSTFETKQPPSDNVCIHPAVLLNAINQLLALDNDLLRIEAGFSEQVDTPSGIITVYMARFTLLDPPHKLMQERQCKLQTLPALRNSPPAELELLRRAYTHVMES
jgi:hypothetical protein